MANWIGAVISLASLVFAIYERAQRKKVEAIIRDTLQRLAGEVSVVYSNANWTDIHLRNIVKFFTLDAPDLAAIKVQAADGARDAAACSRQLSMVHSHIRGVQKSLFDDEGEIRSEIQSDDVRDANRRASEWKAAENNVSQKAQ